MKLPKALLGFLVLGSTSAYSQGLILPSRAGEVSRVGRIEFKPGQLIITGVNGNELAVISAPASKELIDRCYEMATSAMESEKPFSANIAPGPARNRVVIESCSVG